jgi:hypothetical protein
MSVEYLGLIISEGKIRMDLVKLKAIQDWPLPRTVKDIQKFLGFCNFYRRFVKDYSHIAQPLFNLTKKETPCVTAEPKAALVAGLVRRVTGGDVPKEERS